MKSRSRKVEKRYEAAYLPTRQDITIRTPVTLPAVVTTVQLYVKNLNSKCLKREWPGVYEPKRDSAYG
jgi:hypothetical protein